MAKSIQMKDPSTGTSLYPISSTETVYDSDGNKLSDSLDTKADLVSGTVPASQLPTITVAKGGTGATTAAAARTNLGFTLANLGVTATAAELNKMDGVTATASEINKLDGLTATTTELNYVDGVTSNIQTQLNGKAASSHTHTTVNGVYTSSGGAQPPSYIGNGKVHFNMMNKLTGLTSLPSYADLILMDTYSGSDVPYVTAIGVVKTSTPRAYIAVGAKGDTTTWLKQAELISSENIGSQSVNYATSAGSATKATQDGSGNVITSTYAKTSHGTHVTYGTSAKALGTSSAGSASTVSRSDHVHALPALTSCTGTLTVAKGGTGATTAADARANLGAAASSHNQAASTITAGTLAGQVVANATAVATVGTSQVRNIHAGTSDMTAGSSSLTSGAIYLQYE